MLTIRMVNQSGMPLPQYETAGSAGMDLRAKLDAGLTLKPLERALVPTGLYIELPQGYEAQIRPRSGISIKHGITLVNCVGTIDSDYRGEIMIPVINLSQEPYTLKHGERVAQMVIAKYETAALEGVEIIGETDRGAGGFGSTGK